MLAEKSLHDASIRSFRHSNPPPLATFLTHPPCLLKERPNIAANVLKIQQERIVPKQ